MQQSITIANIDIQQDGKGRYCLNDLHRAAGALQKHKPANFLRIDGTKALIAEINQCSDVSSAYNCARAEKFNAGYLTTKAHTLTSSPGQTPEIPTARRPCPTASAYADLFSKMPTFRIPLMDDKLPEILVLNSKCLMAEKFGILFTQVRILAHGNALRSTLYIPGLNPGAFRSRQVIQPDGTERVREQVMVTPKGLTKLAGVFAQ